jgi:hypothetical protein
MFLAWLLALLFKWNDKIKIKIWLLELTTNIATGRPRVLTMAGNLKFYGLVFVFYQLISPNQHLYLCTVEIHKKMIKTIIKKTNLCFKSKRNIFRLQLSKFLVLFCYIFVWSLDVVQLQLFFLQSIFICVSNTKIRGLVKIFCSQIYIPSITVSLSSLTIPNVMQKHHFSHAWISQPF